MNSLWMTVAKMDCHFCKFRHCVSVNSKYQRYQSYDMTKGISLHAVLSSDAYLYIEENSIPSLIL